MTPSLREVRSLHLKDMKMKDSKALLLEDLASIRDPERAASLFANDGAFELPFLHSHEPTMVVNNVVGLAKAAKVFGVPTILTTVLEERGGLLIKGLQDVFPEQKPINRTWINTWQDPRVVGSAAGSKRQAVSVAVA